LCRPFKDSKGEIVGYRHHVVMATIVGTGLSLPIDIEPYGPGDSEYAAGQRVLRRVVDNLGRRFAQYVVVDGEFATAPFLHTADELGLKVIARLKANLGKSPDEALVNAANYTLEVMDLHATPKAAPWPAKWRSRMR
jgi:hypothetical protein